MDKNGIILTRKLGEMSVQRRMASKVSILGQKGTSRLFGLFLLDCIARPRWRWGAINHEQSLI